MRLTIVTGLSGAGRSSALRRLEDLGYYCVDNLLPELLPQFASLCIDSHRTEKAAVAVDMRLGVLFDSIYDVLAELGSMENLDLDILFLDAKDATLVRRFKEVRRNHPVSGSGEILNGVHAERLKLQPLKDMANHVIDTSDYTVMRLRQVVDSMYSTEEDDGLRVSIISFGYKRGIPLDADMVFDMRFLPNPYWVEELRTCSGKDEAVREYVLSGPHAEFFLDQLTELVTTAAPHFVDEDKKQLVIGIGCTGGMHRSVAMAEELRKRLADQGMRVSLEHRDLQLERNLQS